ncbi:multicopper oxidase family protein [Streptomyces aidingensis]|uniref:Multicopper oxidase CueO n=1 Tax=Streptomyces aidingensis TaxID=910347 RepID=A0A1I1FKZ0_9ACTN|nr:multicopper oxidase family protein [Streptomyces aidingensis]SFB97730.1 Multicopper oxidase with three cupredoxin domains (includes cell division protein FtsP and spore coat protein CotA) [Streptomyces aidingensis]
MTTGPYRPSRRRVLALATGTALLVSGAAACRELTAETTGKVLTSRAPLPEPFQVPLPVPPAARPAGQADGADVYEVEQRAAELAILPGLTTTVWGYDGIFPGPTFTARAGREVRVRVRNRLPVPTSTHLHGGVTPPDSDGHSTDLVLPPGWDVSRGNGEGGGHGAHGGHGGHGDMSLWRFHEQERVYTYPLRQRAATLWYHDHRMDFSAPQVWRGLAGFFLVGDEEEDALPLPRGERDIPLMLCDRAFEEDGSFRYPSLDPSLTGEPGVEGDYHNGVLGDVQLVNGAPWPVLETAAARYRFRLLNAANARRYTLALQDADGRRVPGALVQIGSDGGLLAGPVAHDTLTLAPGERYDVVIDFSALDKNAGGTELTLVNTLGEGGMRQVMRFRVTRREPDDSRVPETLSAPERLRRGEAVATRSFDFRLTHEDGHQKWTVNGRPYRVGDIWARPALDTVELWTFSSDFHHPVHTHLAHFQVVSRNGRAPGPADGGWKDTVDVRPYEVVEALVKFSGYRGRYMMHCHNLEHEDMAMMADFEIV